MMTSAEKKMKADDISGGQRKGTIISSRKKCHAIPDRTNKLLMMAQPQTIRENYQLCEAKILSRGRLTRIFVSRKKTGVKYTRH